MFSLEGKNVCGHFTVLSSARLDINRVNFPASAVLQNRDGHKKTFSHAVIHSLCAEAKIFQPEKEKCALQPPYEVHWQRRN